MSATPGNAGIGAGAKAAGASPPEGPAQLTGDGHLFHGRPLRVLHGTYEIAGQGMMLARALRTVGCDADSLAYRVDWDGRRPDLIVELDRHRTGAGKGLAMLGAFARWAGRYDLFHFHFGTSFFYLAPREREQRLKGHWDLPLLKRMGKRIAFHFHGCDIRNKDHMRATHALATCTECDPFCRPWHQVWLREQAARYADVVFFSTLDLAESVPGGHHLPLAIEAARWSRASDAHPLADLGARDGVRGPVVIAHAPTNRLIKGTRYVEEAVKALRDEGLHVELRLIEKQPWETMPEFLAGCDILVDQLMMGWYGLLAMEGMAEGKAVLAYLRPDFAERLSGCPVVHAEPATILDQLRALVRDPARRAMLGSVGRRYVAAHHDLPVVGAQLLSEYRRVIAAAAEPGMAPAPGTHASEKPPA